MLRRRRMRKWIFFKWNWSHFISVRRSIHESWWWWWFELIPHLRFLRLSLYTDTHIRIHVFLIRRFTTIVKPDSDRGKKSGRKLERSSKNFKERKKANDGWIESAFLPRIDHTHKLTTSGGYQNYAKVETHCEWRCESKKEADRQKKIEARKKGVKVKG